MQRLFDIKKTQLEMIIDRGYTVLPKEKEILTMNLQQFISYVKELGVKNPGNSNRSLLSSFYDTERSDGSTERMLVYYASKDEAASEQISVNVVRRFIALINTYSVTHAILIVDVQLSSPANKALEELRLTKWQLFIDDVLTHNPTHHQLVPHHELLSPEEAHRKKLQLRVNSSGLLILRSDDAIVQYYGWEVGSIIRIHRNHSYMNILAPKTYNYRVVAP